MVLHLQGPPLHYTPPFAGQRMRCNGVKCLFTLMPAFIHLLSRNPLLGTGRPFLHPLIEILGYGFPAVRFSP